MSTKQHPKKSGFTLIELILFMGILSGLLFMITTIFAQTLDSQRESITTTKVAQDGNYILNRLSYDFLQASTIVTPSTLGQPATTLTITVNGQNHTYAISGSNLTLTDQTGSVQLNGYETTASNFTVSRYGNTDGKHTVSVSFTLTSKTRKNTGFEVENFQSTFGLR